VTSCYITDQVIYSHGGIVLKKYDPVLCTHLIAQRTNSEICRKVGDCSIRVFELSDCYFDRPWLMESALVLPIG